MPIVTTTEILARRHLARSCGQECVDWAVTELTEGQDTPALRILAGMTPPLNHFELAQLRGQALLELGR